MDIIEQIKKLAGGAADKVLEKYDAKRIGAEAERRGLFSAWMRNASSATLADLLRERHALKVEITDDELKAEFAARGLRDAKSYQTGADRNEAMATQARDDEAARVKALAFEIRTRVRTLASEIIERANLL